MNLKNWVLHKANRFENQAATPTLSYNQNAIAVSHVSNKDQEAWGEDVENGLFDWGDTLVLYEHGTSWTVCKTAAEALLIAEQHSGKQIPITMRCAFLEALL